MNDIGYKEILHATRIEPQPTSRLQDIEGHHVSHSRNPRAESLSETGLPQIQGTCGSRSIGILRAGDLRMDLDRRLLWKANEEVHLTPKEFELLSNLFKNEGAVVTHVKLLRGVWGPEYGNELEYLQISLKAYREELTLRDAAVKLGFLTAKQFDEWVRPEDMTHPLDPEKTIA
jgi:hypothetical protein